MTAIDWDQPVETSETPPRPVRVLQHGTDVEACVLGGELWWIDRDERCWRQEDNEDGDYVYVTLRNVAPKPISPVDQATRDSMEWDELTADRDKWKARAEAAEAGREEARKQRDDASMIIEALQTEVTRVTGLCDRPASDCRFDRISGAALRAEVEMMRPVVDAAVARVDRWLTLRDPWEGDVFEAVRAYKEKTDG
jgi:hypothetical protein